MLELKFGCVEMDSFGNEEMSSKQLARMIRDFEKAKWRSLTLSAHVRGRSSRARIVLVDRLWRSSRFASRDIVCKLGVASG